VSEMLGRDDMTPTTRTQASTEYGICPSRYMTCGAMLAFFFALSIDRVACKTKLTRSEYAPRIACEGYEMIRTMIRSTGYFRLEL
jgi:hypothetical protein